LIMGLEVEQLVYNLKVLSKTCYKKNRDLDFKEGRDFKRVVANRGMYGVLKPSQANLL